MLEIRGCFAGVEYCGKDSQSLSRPLLSHLHAVRRVQTPGQGATVVLPYKRPTRP